MRFFVISDYIFHVAIKLQLFIIFFHNTYKFRDDIKLVIFVLLRIKSFKRFHFGTY